MEDIGIYFLAVWSVSHQSGNCGNLVHFMVIWNTFFRIWYFLPRKIWQPCSDQPPRFLRVKNLSANCWLTLFDWQLQWFARPTGGRCYDFLNIFAKKSAKKLAILTQNKAKLC
jgi:hypothetical protein